VDVLPPIPKDTTDRNRTSPLAFTGNKFELRMLGSSQSIAEPNIALNTIMAEELRRFADVLEKAENFDEALHDLVCQALTQHSRIIFSGNGYSEEWKEEAKRRGLSNLPSAADALATYVTEKNIDLVTRHGIFTEAEFKARHTIHLESYNKIVAIEARTMADMAVHQILPAAMRYTHTLCDGLSRKMSLGLPCKTETALVEQLSTACDALYDHVETLKFSLAAVPADAAEASQYYRKVIVPAMEDVRREADVLEALTEKSYWPYPTYSDLLFY